MYVFATQVFLMSLLDLPFSISPVVTGLMLTLLYGRTGWFAALLRETGICVVFAFTGEQRDGGSNMEEQRQGGGVQYV